jgi:hypothetical protein
LRSSRRIAFKAASSAVAQASAVVPDQAHLYQSMGDGVYLR